MSGLDPVGYGRYVVSVRYDENTPISMTRTDDLHDAEQVRKFFPEAIIWDSERGRYVEVEE